MHREVVPRWHDTFSHLLGDVLGVWLRNFPVGKIQMPPAVIHVSLDKPRYGCDIGIPGPHGFVAVTIKAGPVDQLPRFRRIPRGLASRRRILVVVAEWNELNEDSGQQYPFQNPHRHVPSINQT